MIDVMEDAPANLGTPADPLCRCGSGLRQARCCDLPPEAATPVAAEGPHAEALTALTRAYQADDRDTALALALEILDESPGQKEALGALFNVLKDAGKLDAAAVIIDRMTRVYPDDATPRMVAAGFYLARNDLPRGQFHARMLVRLAPEEMLAHQIMGRIFLAAGRAVAAEHHFRTALSLGAGANPTMAVDLEANLAVALRDQGRLDEGRAAFAALTDRHGPDLAILLAWAGLEESARDFAASADLLDRALQLAPGNAQALMARAGLYRRVKDGEKALETLAAIPRDANDPDEAVGGSLQKGLILDSLGRYDEAFEMFDAFKRDLRERRGQAYQAEAATALVTALKGFFTQGRSRLLPRADTRRDSPQPIFIVGFPRSGTTLVEQTLTSHAQIAAGDELPIINAVTERAQMLLGSPASYPIALSELWLGDRVGLINTLRDLYLNDAAQMGVADPAKRWFTDKMPLNETHLGLIGLMFPESPILHVVRHPLDVILSVFSNGLTHGFNCASALETAAQHYVLIADLIAHYRAAMPLHYHAVRYEDLVTDQERAVRGMLDFVGEPFDARTLAFHENARPARTASYAQVTEKLYERSRYRYRNYLQQLAPAIPILEPVIERLGYTIET